MAFKYVTTSPTAIKYNGTDLTVLKYGTTAVWGKPYSLSISAGSNTTVTVNRTSSPNQHATTGTLSSGSVIYYGDVLTISYSVSSGYAISTHTVNGTTFTSGQSFTVTSAISVVTTAVASSSWKTVWTGNSGKSTSSSFSINISGMVSNAQKTRLTFKVDLRRDVMDYDTGQSSLKTASADITAKEIACGLSAGYDLSYAIFEGKASNYAPVNLASINAYSASNNVIYFRTTSYSYDDGYVYESVKANYVTLTKVEQYY